MKIPRRRREGGGVGVANAKLFKEKYGANFEIPEEWGRKPKTTSMGGMEIL